MNVWMHHKGCTLEPQRLFGYSAVGNNWELLSFTHLLTCMLTLQGPAAAAAYEAAQPYSAFYKLLPVLSGTGVGRKLQQGGPQQPAAGVHAMNPTRRFDIKNTQPWQLQQGWPQQPAGVYNFLGSNSCRASDCALHC
jgi:hypothetical protein